MSRETPTEALAGLMVLIGDLRAGAQPCDGMSLFMAHKMHTLCRALDLRAQDVVAAADAQVAARDALYQIKEGSRASTPS